MNIEETLNARETVYGGFHNVADTAQMLKTIMQQGRTYSRLNNAETEALDMIASKIARIVNGERHSDNWIDIGGYATLGKEAGE